MPSPFPGMDPYVEGRSLWPDCHLAMIAAMRAALNKILPERYAAFADLHVWLYEPDTKKRTRSRKPDVYVHDRAESATSGEALATLVAPAVVTLPIVGRQGNRYLKVIDRHSRRVVTAIEMLSSANKDPTQDRDAYLAKRREYLAAGTNLVEIDLLRAGRRVPLGKPMPPVADYYFLICRAAEFPRAGIWPFSVRDPLPTIPVPLNPEDDPVPLPLRSCFDRAYDESAYDRELDYSKPLRPPLREADAAWARKLLSRRLH